MTRGWSSKVPPSHRRPPPWTSSCGGTRRYPIHNSTDNVGVWVPQVWGHLGIVKRHALTHAYTCTYHLCIIKSCIVDILYIMKKIPRVRHDWHLEFLQRNPHRYTIAFGCQVSDNQWQQPRIAKEIEKWPQWTHHVSTPVEIAAPRGTSRAPSPAQARIYGSLWNNKQKGYIAGSLEGIEWERWWTQIKEIVLRAHQSTSWLSLP